MPDFPFVKPPILLALMSSTFATPETFGPVVPRPVDAIVHGRDARLRWSGRRVYGDAGPAPTKVFQPPQPSTTSSGTCIASPGRARRTVNVTSRAPGGGV